MHVTWDTAYHELLYYTFENKDFIFRVEVVSDLAYEFCFCVDISVNHILTKSGNLMK